MQGFLLAVTLMPNITVHRKPIEACCQFVFPHTDEGTSDVAILSVDDLQKFRNQLRYLEGLPCTCLLADVIDAFRVIV